MEWLLLLLLSSAATGVIAYFLKEDPTKKEKESDTKEMPQTQSVSSIPEAKQKVSLRIDKEDLQKFKTFIHELPTPIQPEVKQTSNLKEEIQQIRQNILRKKKPLKVTYSTDDIIPRASSFSRHRRPLQNAEKFVEEQKAKEALNIYERLEKRIPDEEIKRKIQTNIEDIKKWLMGIEEDEPIEFPEIIIPLSTQVFALEQFNEGIKKISDSIAQELSKILLEGLKQIQSEFKLDKEISIKELKADTISVKNESLLEKKEKEKFGDNKTPRNVIEAKEIREERIEVGGSGKGVIDSSGVIEAKEIREKDRSSITDQKIIQNDYTNIYYQFIPIHPDRWIQTEKGLVDINGLTVPLPLGQKVPTRPQEYFEGLLNQEGFQFDEEGDLITEGWTDKDFEREWQKYKHLPLIDRRSGKERRGEYKYDPNRPDRRQGEDRRKVNLFEERDEFLEKYKKHQERKKALELQKKYWEKQKNILENPIPPFGQIPIFPTIPFYREDLEELEFPEPKIDTIQEIQEISEKKEEIPSHKEEVEFLQKEKEEPPLAKLELPESTTTQEIFIDLPESSLQESEIEPQKASETSPISKVEIWEPPLEELFLPDPILIEEVKESEKPEEAPQKEDAQRENQEQQEEGEKEDIQNSPPSLETEKQQLGEGVEELDLPEIPDTPEAKGPIQEIRGVLELKPPDEEDAPFLTLTYDFSKIPDSFQLSKNYHTLEYVYYKYKPLLIKAQEFARRKMIKNALNYYRMIKSQNIPPEFKRMINRNIQDITDYIEKFMMSRSE
ncbi:MAG: hypothetical protein ACK4UJ_10465 [Leptonema sp. (in: bacteria)]